MESSEAPENHTLYVNGQQLSESGEDLKKPPTQELLTDYYTDQQYFAQDHVPHHTQDAAARLFADFLEFGMSAFCKFLKNHLNEFKICNSVFVQINFKLLNQLNQLGVSAERAGVFFRN